jgi:6-phosphogluconolactonase (cycloisomerase 2 family)
MPPRRCDLTSTIRRITMRHIRRRTLGPLALCAALTAASLSAFARFDDDDGFRSGMVFTSSNSVDGNELLVYARGRHGALSLRARFATGGLGDGAGLGSQGAVTLSGDGRHLFVVNAGSHTVSTFHIGEHDLRVLSVVPSGGLHPISVTEHDGTVYVLNDAGAGNVAGFENAHGELRPIAGSVRGLSVAGGAAPAQIGFSDDGDALVVTEKNTNRLTSYPVLRNGTIGAPIITPSPGLTPFGFAFNRRNRLLVTEAAAGAAGASSVSSYRFAHDAQAQPTVVSASVADTQGSACWVAITPDGRYAYVANTGSGSLSSYRIDALGQIELAQAVAGATGTASAPADTAVSPDGRHVFTRNGGAHTIASFTIEADGRLAGAQFVDGLPAAAVGLAAN